MANELWRMGAVDTAAAIAKREVSCLEVTEAAIARLDAVGGQVNAVTVGLTDAAREAAREADAALAAGRPPGPLHGVPVTIKENVDQAGTATTNGVRAFQAIVAKEDSPVVTNLRKAGAIIIGRTNTPEFSLRWFTANPLRGVTRNPWDETRTPGGSSGGAAAAVALGIGAVAHGNDLGGSLRYPAYCCGVATIRPSLGRVPAYNPSGAEERPPSVQLMSVQGPIAREVRDVRLALAAMAGADAHDPWWTPAPPDGPTPARPIRVAVTTEPGGVAAHPAVAAAVEAAADYLAAAGYAVERVDPPHVAEIAETWGRLLFTETRHMMGAAIRQYGGGDIVRVLDGYEALHPALDLDGYMRALADRARLLRAWTVFLERYPLVLAPVSQEPPFPDGDDLAGLDRLREILASQRMLVAVNLLGLPSAAVPTGLADGMPVGVQIVGPRFREDLCLDAAEAVERAVGPLAPQLWERL